MWELDRIGAAIQRGMQMQLTLQLCAQAASAEKCALVTH